MSAGRPMPSPSASASFGSLRRPEGGGTAATAPEAGSSGGGSGAESCAEEPSGAASPVLMALGVVFAAGLAAAVALGG